MARSFVLITTMALLMASGVVLYSQIRENGVAGTFSFGGGGKQAATRHLMAAAAALQHSIETGGTYRRTDLSRFSGVHFASVSDSGYCIQVQKGEKWYHLLGPGGVPTAGAC